MKGGSCLYIHLYCRSVIISLNFTISYVAGQIGRRDCCGCSLLLKSPQSLYWRHWLQKNLRLACNDFFLIPNGYLCNIKILNLIIRGKLSIIRYTAYIYIDIRYLVSLCRHTSLYFILILAATPLEASSGTLNVFFYI